MYRSIKALSYTVPDFETTGSVGGLPETGNRTVQLNTRDILVAPTGTEKHPAGLLRGCRVSCRGVRRKICKERPAEVQECNAFRIIPLWSSPRHASFCRSP